MAEPIEVPFSDDQALDIDVSIDDGHVSPGDSPADRALRTEKRKARASQREQERKAQAEELASERQARQVLEQRLARLEGTTQALVQPQKQGADPYQAQLDALYTEQQNAYKQAQNEMLAKQFTPERQQYYDAVARSLEERKARVHTSRAMAEAEAVNRQAAGQQVWVQKYPEVYSNPRAFNYAKATFERRQALGENVGPEAVDEIMQETRAALKIGPKPSPTQNERARMSGIASGGGGSSSNGEPSGGVRMTPDLRKMAIALYSDLPEDKAVDKWVQTAGKNLRREKVI